VRFDKEVEEGEGEEEEGDLEYQMELSSGDDESTMVEEVSLVCFLFQSTPLLTKFLLISVIFSVFLDVVHRSNNTRK
jgi:hypothetical protein